MTPRAARCAGCGNVASADWFTFGVDAAPGPREANRWSAVRTEIRAARLCPDCCASPAWSALLALVYDKGQPAEGYGGQCVVLCSSHSPKRSHRWAKLGARAVVIWPESAQYRCPMCYRNARGWKIHAAPRAVRDLAARVVRRRRLPRRPEQEAGREPAGIEQ